MIPCIGCLERPVEPVGGEGVLAWPLRSLDDPEGERLPADLPPVWDAHVHVFPDRLFEAIWAWFDAYGWPVRYKLHAAETCQFLLNRGVERIVALHYAHKPGIARSMNRFVAELCATDARIIGVATVCPGEPDASAILDEAFAAGLRGVKLHCHVQCIAPDDPALHEVYAKCAAAGLPVVIHAGREPKSPAYNCDPYALCGVERVARVLADHPKLKLCVPHLGLDEIAPYVALMERVDNLWLDTTMAVAGYFPCPLPDGILEVRPERMLYGTDFPNLPYAWDREVLRLRDSGVKDDVLEAILGGTARGLFGG